MKKIFFLNSLLWIFPLLLTAQVIFRSPLSPRIANYKIDAILNTRDKKIEAHEQLTWENSSAIPVTELRFHLYMNAFRNKESTFLRDIESRHRRIRLIKEHVLGGIDLNRIILNGNTDLTGKIEFIQPDDGNVHDSTVIRILLPTPVQPRRTVTLDIDFQTRLPRIIARTGYNHDYFLIGQWFPKIGVWQDGKWNCHQFHINSEFFADFGVYQVNLTLPQKYVVGATGILLDKQSNDSLKTLSFRAEDVHDFAITAWPNFRREERTINGINVVLLYAPEHARNVERYFSTISGTMNYLGNWLMPYPYPNLTMVDVPLFAFLSSGMEYPCFITCGSIWGVPRDIRLFPEEVTIHEFSHQYFYGILATNEFEEPWLDEGFTSYATLNVMDELFGLHTSLSTFLNINRGELDSYRKAYINRPNLDFVVKPSWDFKLGGYGTFSYGKPALILKTMENYLGQETMTQGLREYLARWKFKHPQTGDFLQVVQEISPDMPENYFDQALYGTEVLDYSVERVSCKKVTKPEGNDTITSQYQCTIDVRRRGTFIFPVEIAAIFADGDTVLVPWDGKDPYKVVTLIHSAEIKSATVDPHQKIWLDVNWTNNSRIMGEEELVSHRHWLQALKLVQQMFVSIFSF
jgi:hypothetical protein